MGSQKSLHLVVVPTTRWDFKIFRQISSVKMSYGRGPPNIKGMTSLKVDNLTYRTTPDMLRRAFERYGEVGDLYIPRDRFTRESRGFAFVRYYDRRDAEDAMESMDGRRLDGRELRVQVARCGRPDAPPRDRRSRSRSYDRRRRRSRSRSRSRSRRRSRSRSGSRSRSRSKSPVDDKKSRSRSPSKEKSRSKSPMDTKNDKDKEEEKEKERSKSRSRSKSKSRSKSR